MPCQWESVSERACLDECGPAGLRLRLGRLDGDLGPRQVENRGAFFRSRVRAIITGRRGLPGVAKVDFAPPGIDETIFDHEDGQLPIMPIVLNRRLAW